MTAAVASHAAARSAAGLVSVPTTPTRAANVRVMAESDLLREHLDAFVPDVEQTRLARLRRSVGFAARCHAVSERGHRNDVPWMVTLTYAAVDGWKPDDITKALECYRQWCKRKGFACRYVWVAELQQRGAIHYHICCWLPKGQRMPKWDVRTSSHRLARRWWPHGMTNRKVARNAVPYLMKYMSKGSADVLKGFPRGARIYGVGGLEHALRRARRWLGLPAFVQGNSSIFDGWKRAEGGGWRAPSGDLVESEFRRTWVGDRYALCRVARHDRAIEANGPFCWLSDRDTAFKHTVH